MSKTGVLSSRISRRTFLKSAAFLGSTLAAANAVPWFLGEGQKAEGGYSTPTAGYPLAKPENIIYSACLQCQIRCLLKVKQQDGVVVKIDGNPYSAKQFLPNIPYATSPVEAVKMDGKLCPKGQAGVQTHYDPYRLRQVLKRVGPRGSGKWQSMDFHKAIDEIVNGGDLFGEGPVLGLKDIYALRDPKVAAAIAADVDKLKKRQLTVAEFKASHASHLSVLIDPDHPDLGPKNNQFLFMPGRINRTRIHFANRFVKDAFGSVNSFEHTSICELSVFICTGEMTRNLATGASKGHFKPDFINSEFLILWGTGFAEANFGVTPMAELVTRGIAERNLKFAVVDPRLSKSAGRAWRWLPVKPGGDAALALGMIRWILDNERYDKRYLENPNLEAAQKDGETTSTDATHLVRTDQMVLLRAEDIGLAVPPAEAGKPKLDYFVVMTGDGPQRHDQADAGVLDVNTTIQRIPVKSVFTLLKERAQELSLPQYADLSGIPVNTIVEVAQEFTSHGKKAAIDMYRGPTKHTNGFAALQAINTLNILIGNMDWKGGLADGGGGWDDLGGKEGQPFPLGRLHPNKTRSFGVTLSREGWRYEESTLFERDGGYPAKRPWFPFAFNMWHDLIPSAEAGYPYPIKLLWLHKGTPAYSVPGAGEQLRILRDPKIIPLFISTDIVIGETSMYADYIFPDGSYLEQWASPGDVPEPATKSNPFRQPAAAPVPEIVTIDGEKMPISLEAVMLALAQRLGLPGFGKDGLGPDMPLKRTEDYYLKVAANLAFGDKKDGSDSVPDASDEEVDLFRQARRHLTQPVFDELNWQRAVGPLWRKVVYVLNRGGRFEHFSQVYDGDRMAHRFGGTFHLYLERVMKQKDSITGLGYDGLPRYAPPLFSNGKPVGDEGYSFQLITFKEVSGSQSRTPGTYWTQVSLLPENFVLMNQQDAQRLRLADGDRVRLTSRSNGQGVLNLGEGQRRDMVGKVRVIQGIRPGVVAVSQSLGHWGYGARGVEVDGIRVPGDSRRGKGLQINPLLRLDDHTKTGCLTEPIGGSASFYDTRVNVIPA